MKHIMIEKFVEFFICEVDAELLKGVDLWAQQEGECDIAIASEATVP